MKKLIAVSLFISLMVSHCVSAKVFVDKDVTVEGEYYMCSLDDHNFLVPKYFTDDGEVDEGGDSVDLYALRDIFKDIELMYFSMDSSDELSQRDIEYDLQLSRHAMIQINAYSLYNVIPLAFEEVEARSFECSLATMYDSDKKHIIKMAAFYDPDAMKMYEIAFKYKTESDGTKYTDDFYKILYEDPLAENMKAIEELENNSGD